MSLPPEEIKTLVAFFELLAEIEKDNPDV